MWWIVLALVVPVGALIIILIATSRGPRSVRPDPGTPAAQAGPMLDIRLTAVPPIICSGDVVAPTWHSTGAVADRIEETNESAIAVESGGTPATTPSPLWDRTSTEPTHTENVTVYENWYFRATAVSGTTHFTSSVRVTVFQPGEWIPLAAPQSIPARPLPIVCGRCEGQVEIIGRINLPPEEWSPQLRGHRIRLRPGFDRQVLIVHHFGRDFGSRFELRPGDPPVEIGDMPMAGTWLLCTPPLIQDCPIGEDLTHPIGGQPGVPDLNIEIEIACV